MRQKLVPTIEFLPSRVGKQKQVDAPEGGELVDLCDEVLAPVPFSCRSASCGTCKVEVLAGAELLVRPEPEERELLSALNAAANHRLACQVRVRPGSGLVQLRATLVGEVDRGLDPVSAP